MTEQCHTTNVTMLMDRLFDFETEEKCYQKVDICISKLSTNPYKLYFHCEKGKCNFYSFWEPDEDKINMRSLEALPESFAARTTNVHRIKVHTEAEAKSSIGNSRTNIQQSGNGIEKN